MQAGRHGAPPLNPPLVRGEICLSGFSMFLPNEDQARQEVTVNGLKVRNLVKTLSRGAPANAASAVLRDVSLSVAKGECLGLKGATGSGKTTLLRIIAGLLPPDSGEVLIDGAVCSSPAIHVPPAQRRIGFVFQNLGLWPHLNVLGHLEYVLAAAPYSAEEKKTRITAMLDTFVLHGLEKRYPAELSGGERHLLALARALVGDIRLLLLDEPFTGLDGALKDRVLHTLRSERERRQLTTLLVTHDSEEMRMLCQRVEKLSEGHVIDKIASPQA
jgi:ABC-type sulfate/molybdate transport systems ATPase subunit